MSPLPIVLAALGILCLLLAMPPRDPRPGGTEASGRPRLRGGPLARALERRSRTRGPALGDRLAGAGSSLRPGEFLLLRAVAAILGAAILGVAGLLRGGPAAALALGLAGALLGARLPAAWLSTRLSRRSRAFSHGLPDAAMLIANALRAGNSLLQAVDLLVRETTGPVGEEFGRVLRDMGLGLPLPEALGGLRRRVPSTEVDLLVTAVITQSQVGGNLAEILDTIAATVRDRERIRAQVRTLTAQQRLSGYVVAALPVLLLVGLSVIAPGFIAPMFQDPPSALGLPMGVVLLGVGGLMMTIGFLIIRRIVRIEV